MEHFIWIIILVIFLATFTGFFEMLFILALAFIVMLAERKRK